jgi:RimJ/RimL family protein N-acetyltransferase
MTILTTANLVLSPCTPEDRSDFVALEQDPQVMLFLTGGKPIDRATHDPASDILLPEGSEDCVWTARRRNNRAFVGWFCLWPNGGKDAELGYRLHRTAWGSGLATEGAAALVNWGFAIASYDKIVACTMASNRASRRVLEKIGMAHVRTDLVDWAAAIPGGEQGEVFYAMERCGTPSR